MNRIRASILFLLPVLLLGLAVPAMSEDTTPPTVPSHLTLYPYSSYVSMTWRACTDDTGVVGYTVYRDALAVGVVNDLAGTQGIYPGFVDYGVSEGTTYTYDVDAFDAAGNHSFASTPVTCTTLRTIHVESITPSTSISGGNETLTFSVLAAQRSLAPSTSTQASGRITLPGGAFVTRSAYTDGNGVARLSYTATGLLPTGTYTFLYPSLLRPGYLYDSAQNKVTTASYSVAGDTAPPSIPTILSATPNTTQSVSLRWTRSSDNVAVAGYEVYRDGYFAWTVPAVANTSVVYFSDPGPFAEKSVIPYQVNAYDTSSNRSALSAPLSATIPWSTHCETISLALRYDKATRTDFLDATVKVNDRDNLAVSGALVSGFFTLANGAAYYPPAQVTGADGAVKFTYPATANGKRLARGTYSFTITGISRAGTFYDSAQNGVTTVSLVKSR